MTADEIREVVKITLDELFKKGMMEKENYRSVLKVVEPLLYDFFGNVRIDGTGISWILHSLSDDYYIDIIYFQYRDKVSLEQIAEYLEKDISTIKRNKKRLIMQIYSLLDDFYK